MADKLSRLDVIKDNSGNILAEYAWNGAGRLVKETYKRGTSPNEVVTVALDYTGSSGTYAGFDRFGRVVDQKWVDSSGTVVDRFQYGYDRVSNRTYRDNVVATGLDWKYTYDGLNRLQTADRGTVSVGTDGAATISSPTQNEDWTLDALGNWATFRLDSDGGSQFTAATDLSQTRQHNLVNEITAGTYGQAIVNSDNQTVWINPAYDSDGNMTFGPKPNAEGEPLKLVYDAWNRLSEVWVGTDSNHDGVLDAGSASRIAIYRYDGLGRRIRKFMSYQYGEEVYWYGVEYYYNKAWQLLEERYRDEPFDATEGDPSFGAPVLSNQFVWSARYIDAPVLRRDCGYTPAKAYYFTSDANMNVTGLFRLYVGSLWQMMERYDYDPYGRTRFLNANWTVNGSYSPSTTVLPLYCGYLFDYDDNGQNGQGPGLYHVRHRTYHPTLGRWATRDRLEHGASTSFYLYGECAPLSAVDPSGDLIMILSGLDLSGGSIVSGPGFGRATSQALKTAIDAGLGGAEAMVSRPEFGEALWAKLDAVALENSRLLPLPLILRQILGFGDCHREPIILIGYSDGATRVKDLAQRLQGKYPRETIDYVGIIDMVRPGFGGTLPLAGWAVTAVPTYYGIPLPVSVSYAWPTSTTLPSNILAGDNIFQTNGLRVGTRIVPISTGMTMATSGGTVKNLPYNAHRMAVSPSIPFGSLATHDTIHLDGLVRGVIVRGALTAWASAATR